MEKTIRKIKRHLKTDGTVVPGGYLLHSSEARTLASRLASLHSFALGLVIALVAIDLHSFDRTVTIFLFANCLLSAVIPFFPWGRYSHNWLAKLYILGIVIFVFFAFQFDNPYLLLGTFPEMVALADVYWYRRWLVVLHVGAPVVAVVVSALLIGGPDSSALVIIAAPLMAASAVLVGAMSYRFVQSVLQHAQFQSAVDSLLAALHARDGYTGDHSKITLAMTRAVADELDLNSKARAELADVALLHDIGKLGIPNSILQKPGGLSENEWTVMRQHPIIGEQILAGVPGFESVALAVRHEHERWDGAGYPDGIKGDAIPLASRIVFVCDAVHAMTSDRPYRAAMELSDACTELHENSGSQFDPAVVAAFERSVKSGAFAKATEATSLPALPAPTPLREPAASAPFELPASHAEKPTVASLFDDPHALIVMSMANAALAAIVMATYLVVQNTFDWVGVGFVAVAAAVSVIGYALRGPAPMSWSFTTAMAAYVVVPYVAFHFDQPAMMTLLLGNAAMLSGFFWQRSGLRIVQILLMLLEFFVLPFLLFGTGIFTFAIISLRAFPGALLLVGYFAMQLTAMRFERERFTGTMGSLLRALQARDGYTADHSRETVTMALRVGDELGLDESARLELKDVALLHDIGKLGIPDEILNKPGPLTPDEWKVMHLHPVIGEQIIFRVPGCVGVAGAIRHEHERWDGGGYPDGLSGKDIPLSSRIVFACDAFHAMTSDRPYRKSLGQEVARAEMVQHAGAQFDPEIVIALLSVLDRLDDEQRALATELLAA